MVAKLPNKLEAVHYNLEAMSKDIEAMFICNHIVSEFNDRIINIGDVELLIEFVHSFIYELIQKVPSGQPKYKYYYGENFIPGKYEKYNNNAGWMNS
mmetsp:Transcript_42583/g.31173  ORF Transcript_42583/g.31173 Transcript_42583/m.31173 type:complete len:97 (+) Transcript_42583:574-864(+)